MVEVINRRANLLIKNNVAADWCREVEFQALVCWTRGAGPKELAQFNEDMHGQTYYKNLFFNLMQ